MPGEITIMDCLCLLTGGGDFFSVMIDRGYITGTDSQRHVFSYPQLRPHRLVHYYRLHLSSSSFGHFAICLSIIITIIVKGFSKCSKERGIESEILRLQPR